MSIVSSREQEVIDNPELHLNQYLQDMADVHNYPYTKMYAFAKIHFKSTIPRNKIETIVDQRFRNSQRDTSEFRKPKPVTKKSNESIFRKLPKNIQQEALKAVNPLIQSLYHFSEDD